MEEKKNGYVFRKLNANEIECRVGATNESGFTLLLYKDARVDMNLLDEVVGASRWQRKHYLLGGDIYCSVGIYYDDIGWVWKDDAGASGTIEIEKSKASDSFKRACVNATGVGRELYTAPFIWIVKDQDNDPKKSHYFVKEIEYKDNEISKLLICNEKTNTIVYSYPKGAKVSVSSQNQGQNTTTTPKASYTPNDIMQEQTTCLQKVRDFGSNLPADKYTKFFNWVEEKYGTRVINNLTLDQLKEIIKLYKL